MSDRHASDNPFLTAPIGRLFAQNALPMAVIMALSGLLNLTDALFLGRYAGPSALAAISLTFPPVMLTVALSTLVSGGMSSLLARHLGAGDIAAAGRVLARAHGLALLMAGLSIAALLLLGRGMIDRMAAGEAEVAQMGWTYLSLLTFATPVQYLLGLHADCWRNEGRAAMMAALSLGVTLANIALNALLITGLGWGVAGAAIGTILAQAFGLMLLVALRGRGRVPLSALWRNAWIGGWGPILSLGAPVSLSFLGIALVSGCVLAALRVSGGEFYATSVAAYGIVTRLTGFAFLPLMAMGLALQSIAGNNAGAGRQDRAEAALRLAALTALVYGAAVQALVFGAGEGIARGFTSDPAVAAEAARILRWMMAFYLFTGPVLLTALWLQALGQPVRTAALTLVKPFLLTPALIALVTSAGFGEGPWRAFPVSDLMMLALAAVLIAGRRRAVPA